MKRLIIEPCENGYIIFTDPTEKEKPRTWVATSFYDIQDVVKSYFLEPKQEA